MENEKTSEVAKPKARKKKKTVRKNIVNGIVHVQSTFNNTIVTVTDEKGEVVAWSSAGKKGFKGARKSTPFAATVVAEDAMASALNLGVKRVAVLVSGPGAGRETALRAIAKQNLEVTLIKDVTPIPHNGCRPPKRRRV
jgi:small subunit ribosomal protein S11